MFDFHLLPSQITALWHGATSNLISTIVVLMVTLLIRTLILIWLERHTTMTPDTVFKWRQRIRFIGLIFVVIAMMVIWAPQLRAFAVSIVAVSAAIVIGLKEIINSLIGGFIRNNVEGSRLGGRMTINGIRGDIVSNDILSTSLLEVNENGLRTGRMVIVPNSHFVTHAAVTEFFMDRKFTLIWVIIPMKITDDWHAMEDALLDIGQRISQPYMAEASRYFERFNRKLGLNIPVPEPRVFVEWPEADKLSLKMRMAVPVAEQAIKRQEILRHVLGLNPHVELPDLPAGSAAPS